MSAVERAALLTAAGSGERPERIERLAACFNAAGIKRVVAVTGPRAKSGERGLSRRGVTFIRDERGETTQMLDSVKLGLRFMEGSVDEIFVCPCGAPTFDERTVAALIEAHAAAAVPRREGRDGHPILISAELIPAIVSYDGEGGLGAALASIGVTPLAVEVDEAPERGPDALLPRSARPIVKITLGTDDPFYGPGTQRLLSHISKFGSVRAAASALGISYSKAWTILNDAEAALGRRLVDRSSGGACGCKCELRGFALDIMARFDELESRIESAAREAFDEIFDRS